MPTTRRTGRGCTPDSRGSSEAARSDRSEEHTSELQSPDHLVCRLLLRAHLTSTLFPYTTLFRSQLAERVDVDPDVLFRVLDADRPLLLVARRHEDASVDQPCPRRGEQVGVALQIVAVVPKRLGAIDRKSTRLNSSHQIISYAVSCSGHT